MNPLTPYLLWIKLGAAVALVGALTGWHVHKVNSAREQGYAQAVADRATADLTAIVSRTVENKVIADTQHNINVAITKAKDEELAPVFARVASAPGLRRPRAICNAAPRPPEAPSPPGSDSADPPSGLVRADVDRDIRALIIDVEQDLATGRACQAFLEKNGLIP